MSNNLSGINVMILELFSLEKLKKWPLKYYETFFIKMGFKKIAYFINENCRKLLKIITLPPTRLSETPPFRQLFKGTHVAQKCVLLFHRKSR
jgi:hypothetical protein